MRFYPLYGWVDMGKMSPNDPIDFDFEVTEDEYTRLQQAQSVGLALSDPELADLHERAREAWEEESIRMLREFADPDEEDLSDEYFYYVGFKT